MPPPPYIFPDICAVIPPRGGIFREKKYRKALYLVYLERKISKCVSILKIGAYSPTQPMTARFIYLDFIFPIYGIIKKSRKRR